MLDTVNAANALTSSSRPETLHDLRVSLRRLRVLGGSYKSLIPDTPLSKHQPDYRHYAAIAGQTRDWDVLGELVERHASVASPSSSHAGAPKKSGTSGRGRQRAAELIREIRKRRNDAAMISRSRLAAFNISAEVCAAVSSTHSQLMQSAKSEEDARVFARKRIRAAKKSLKKRVLKAHTAPAGHYELLHDVRKSLKKLRYLLEFFSPYLKNKTGKQIKRIRHLQTRFGKLNDLVASEAVIAGTAWPAVDPKPEIVLSWLHKRRKHHAKKVRGLLPEMR